MSVSLDTAGAIVFKSSSATAAGSYAITLNAPTSVTAARSIAMYDPGANCNIQFGKKQVITTAAITPLAVTEAQSGSIFNVTVQAADIIAVLPAAAAGLEYKFILAGTLTNIFSILSLGVAGTMKGKLNSSAGVAPIEVSTDGFNLLNADTARFAVGAVAGDWIKVQCVDGTNWVATGQSGIADGNLFTT